MVLPEFRAEGVLDMTRPVVGRHHEDVKTIVSAEVACVAADPQTSGIEHALCLERCNRGQPLVDISASLDLDKDNAAAALHDEIDLAPRCFETPGERAIALHHHEHCGKKFRSAAPPFGAAAASRWHRRRPCRFSWRAPAHRYPFLEPRIFWRRCRRPWPAEGSQEHDRVPPLFPQLSPKEPGAAVRQ